jgi:hypothetical protein
MLKTTGSLECIQAAESNNRVKSSTRYVMGPWYHVQWAQNDAHTLVNIHFGSNTSLWYQQLIEIPFFNYYLKGKGNMPDFAKPLFL